VAGTLLYASLHGRLYAHGIGSVPGSAEPQVGGRAGQAEVEVGQRDDADQGDVPGRVGRGEKVARRHDEGEGTSRGASRVARRTAGREQSEVVQPVLLRPSRYGIVSGGEGGCRFTHCPTTRGRGGVISPSNSCRLQNPGRGVATGGLSVYIYIPPPQKEISLPYKFLCGYWLFFFSL